MGVAVPALAPTAADRGLADRGLAERGLAERGLAERGLADRGLADAVAAAVAAVPAALLDAPSGRRLVAAAEVLPARLADTFGFEVPLTGEARGADLGAAAEPVGGDLAALAGRVLPPAEAAHPAWRAVHRLAAACRPGGSLAGRVGTLCLELDVRGPTPRLPSLFFAPVAWHRRNRQDHATAYADTVAALEVVAAAPPDCVASGLLERAFRSLPPAGSVFQLGVMTPRGDRRVRLCAALHNPGTFLAYLDAVGHPGDRDAIERMVRWLRRLTDRLRYGLDLGGAAAGPGLGIECYIHGADAPARWRALLDAFVRVGMATAERRDALLAFPGTRRLGTVPLFGGAGDRVERRRIHHVKVSLRPDEPAAAKAYLAFETRWGRA